MKRENIITFRLSGNEKLALKALAARQGLTASSWLRVQIYKEAQICGIGEMPERIADLEGQEDVKAGAE